MCVKEKNQLGSMRHRTHFRLKILFRHRKTSNI